jgi:ornithine carbamoyltransferase
VTTAVIESGASIVSEQAANRAPAVQAVLHTLVGDAHSPHA